MQPFMEGGSFRLAMMLGPDSYCCKG
jgi:hypothetical protein